MNKDETIGDRLRVSMRNAGFGDNQSELSRESGVSQPTINRILNGGNEGKGPSTVTLQKLADACGVSYMWLLEGGRHNPGRSLKVVQKDMAKAIPPNYIDADEFAEIFRIYRAAHPRRRAAMLKLMRAAGKGEDAEKLDSVGND